VSAQPVFADAAATWVLVCALDDIVPDTGVAALVNGHQVAVFRVSASGSEPEQVFAIDNHDPASGANVLSRGLIGDLGGELMVASPVYKQHFGLRDGRCFEEPTYSVRSWPVRVVDGQVEVRAEP
jgi:NAD(P)H-dependent nitrite reductase small subunit